MTADDVLNVKNIHKQLKSNNNQNFSCTVKATIILRIALKYKLRNNAL